MSKVKRGAEMIVGDFVLYVFVLGAAARILIFGR